MPVPTLRTAEPTLRALIDLGARMYGLQPLAWPDAHAGLEFYLAGEVLEAQVLQESSGDPRAVHVDAHPELPPDRNPDASHGLLQVEGWVWSARLGQRVARGLVSPHDYSALHDPMVGLGAGLQELRDWRARIVQREPSVERDVLTVRALACYNAGGDGDDIVAGKLRNQAYVDAVCGWLPAVRASRIECGWVTR